MMIRDSGSLSHLNGTGKPVNAPSDQSPIHDNTDCSYMAGNTTSLTGSIIDKLKKIKNIVIGNDEVAGKSSEEAEDKPLDPSKLSHPEVYEKIKNIKNAGYTFYVTELKSVERVASDREIYSRYGDNDKSLLGRITIKKADERVALPYTEDDLNLFSFFYLDSDKKSLKNPDIAESIKEVYKKGGTFHDRYLEKCFNHNPTDPLYTYIHAVKLTKDIDAQSDLHFKDGDKFFQIENRDDFNRACVISGAMDEKVLSPDERKALPIIKEMFGKGHRFSEHYGNSAVGPLSILRAIGYGHPCVMYVDKSGIKNEIKCLKDLERIQKLYDKKDLTGMSAQEKILLSQVDDLLKKGAEFTDLSSGNYGAASVVKALLQEDKDVLKESIFFKDSQGMLSEVNRPEDPARINAIYFEKDTKSLPAQEQKILSSLERLIDSKENPAVNSSKGVLGFLKGILGEDYCGAFYMDKADRPLTEKIATPSDIERYEAIYINKNFNNLPPDEKDALGLLYALTSAGAAFENGNAERMPVLQCLKVLKGEENQIKDLWVYSNNVAAEPRTRINNCNDLRRLDALWLKKDISFLPKDEQQIISDIRELRKNGISLLDCYGDSELSILKSMKGESVSAYVAHKSGSQSTLDDPKDLMRLKALYIKKDLNKLPAGEKVILEKISFMKDQGYSCAALYNGKTSHVESFDVLKSTIKKHSNIGFVDKEGAFTEISSEKDLDDLRAIHSSVGLDSFSYKDLKLIKLIQDLMRDGYKFQADSIFSNIDSLGNMVSGTTYYPVGPLAVLKGLRKCNTNLWLFKDGTRIPISKFLNVMDMFDKMEQTGEEEYFPSKDKIDEQDGFVIIGGVRIPVRESKSQ